MRWSITVLLAVLSGCSYTPVDMLTGYDLDSDKDGISDADEIETYGTDPNESDSDGDSHSDGDEIEGGTDPLDADSHPYTGGWEVDSWCRDDITATGNGVGDITADFSLPDQYGEDVSLYDFCGKVVLLMCGAFW